jgi:hypothetical protein
MSPRVIRAAIAALALLCAGLVAGTANADPGVGTGTGDSTPRSTTTTQGNIRCTYYANASGFGTWCGGAQGGSGSPPTWRQRLGTNWPFVPCRNYPIPEGVVLPDPPEGKQWTLRVWIRDYNLDEWDGGDDVHLEHEIVAVTQDEYEHCDIENRPYMQEFWRYFHRRYPTPILVVKPTYIPRVNSPAYFSLGQDTTRTPPAESAYTEVRVGYWNGEERVAMQARVTRLRIAPDDGTQPFECTDVTEYDEYDETKKPTEQTASCKHTFTRSSANKPDGMYTLNISAFWQVRYCLWSGSACDWRDLGTWEVKSVQRLPVQEVQGIGGGR